MTLHAITSSVVLIGLEFLAKMLLTANSRAHCAPAIATIAKLGQSSAAPPIVGDKSETTGKGPLW